MKFTIWDWMKGKDPVLDREAEITTDDIRKYSDSFIDLLDDARDLRVMVEIAVGGTNYSAQLDVDGNILLWWLTPTTILPNEIRFYTVESLCEWLDSLQAA